MKNRVWLLWCCLTLLVAPPISASDIYRCQTSDGQTVFQDLPCEGRAKPIISWSGAKSAPRGISSATRQTSEAVAAPVSEPDQSAPAGGRHLFWQADKRGAGTLYLLGSIHFGWADIYPLPKVISDAFQASDALVVELDALSVDPMVAAQSFAANGMYSGAGSLPEELGEALWQRLVRAATRLGLSPELLSRQKPWLAAMTLSGLSVRQAGFDEGLGIDMHFLKLAQGKLPIIELEGMSYQAQLMATLPPEAQRAMLTDTLRILEEGAGYYQRMIEIWRKGDAVALEGLIQESLGGSGAAEQLNKAILDDRNVAMVARLKALAERGGRYFVVVGAAHLVGPQGIVAALRDQGYAVTQR